MRRLIHGLVAIALLHLTGAARADVVPPNFSFETPNLGSSFQYNPTVAAQGGTGWTFLSSTGITATGSAFGMQNPPDGNQAAFLQATGSFLQAISGFTAGIYQLQFSAQGRSNFGQGPNPFNVQVDGTPLTFAGSPLVTPAVQSTFTAFLSDAFVLTAGAHTLTFIGTNNGSGTDDRTSFIDAVRFIGPTASVPEPSSLVLASCAAVGGLGLATWCRRRIVSKD